MALSGYAICQWALLNFFGKEVANVRIHVSLLCSPCGPIYEFILVIYTRHVVAKNGVQVIFSKRSSQWGSVRYLLVADQYAS